VESIDQRGSMARVHLLIDELPQYLGFDSTSEGPQHRGHQMLGASTANFEKAWEAERRGTLPDEYVIEAIIQSTTDPTLAAPGKHTLTLGVQQLPFELENTTWSAIKESWGDSVVENFCRYAPNIRDHIHGRVVITPQDLETDYNITGGNIFHGQMFLNQLFSSRPLSSISSYRTPIEGYYLCGVGMHPGGGVMGAGGHNAAMVVLADMIGRQPAVAARTTNAFRKGLLDRVMESPLGARVGYEMARQPAFRSLAKRSARRSGGSKTRGGQE
jgi:phytoene dehydrogenase-like protein